jgi:hypothetical protein
MLRGTIVTADVTVFRIDRSRGGTAIEALLSPRFLGRQLDVWLCWRAGWYSANAIGDVSHARIVAAVRWVLPPPVASWAAMLAPAHGGLSIGARSRAGRRRDQPSRLFR